MTSVGSSASERATRSNDSTVTAVELQTARLAEQAEANGASARLLVAMAGDTSEAVLVLEFDSGEAWATLMQSDIVRDARRARFDDSYPIDVINTSVFRELAIND